MGDRIRTSTILEVLSGIRHSWKAQIDHFFFDKQVVDLLGGWRHSARLLLWKAQIVISCDRDRTLFGRCKPLHEQYWRPARCCTCATVASDQIKLANFIDWWAIRVESKARRTQLVLGLRVLCELSCQKMWLDLQSLPFCGYKHMSQSLPPCIFCNLAATFAVCQHTHGNHYHMMFAVKIWQDEDLLFSMYLKSGLRFTTEAVSMLNSW